MFVNSSNTGSDRRHLDWVILGGESGPKARPMHPDWVRSVRDQCQETDVPFYFKQWGEWQEYYEYEHYDFDWTKEDRIQYLHYSEQEGILFKNKATMLKIGTRHTSHLLDSQEIREYPKGLERAS